jgi:hypothetical protein
MEAIMKYDFEIGRRWKDIRAKFHVDRLGHLSKNKVDTATISEVINLVLLRKDTYVVAANLASGGIIYVLSRV